MRTSTVVLVASTTLLLLGCDDRKKVTAPSTAATMEVTSTAFAHGAAIPTELTCEGDDATPPLTWIGAPKETKSFALVMDDPDAPDPKDPKTTWVHWVLYDIPPTVTSLSQALSEPPTGARQGKNDWKKTGYGGPCPPIGRHRYFHKIYALNAMLGDLGEPTKADLEKAMEGHILAKGELIGTYQKTKP